MLSVIIYPNNFPDHASLSEKSQKLALIDFLTGRDDWFKCRPVATVHGCRAYLMRKFPQFSTPEMDGAVEDLNREIKAVGGGARAKVVGVCWLEKQKVKYGEYIAVESMV